MGRSTIKLKRLLKDKQWYLSKYSNIYYMRIISDFKGINIMSFISGRCCYVIPQVPSLVKPPENTILPLIEKKNPDNQPIA